jgi:hypothetical protein
MLKKRKEGLKRKADMAKEIADQTKLSLSVLEAMPPPAPAPIPKTWLKDLPLDDLMALLEEFEATHEETDPDVFASWLGKKFPLERAQSLLEAANEAIDEKYPPS